MSDFLGHLALVGYPFPLASDIYIGRTFENFSFFSKFFSKIFPIARKPFVIAVLGVKNIFSCTTIDIFGRGVCNIITMRVYPKVHKTSPKKVRVSWGTDLYFERRLTSRLVAVLLIAVKPFAYVVCRCTCQHGQEER